MIPRHGLAFLLRLLLLSSAALAQQGQGQPLRPQDLDVLHGLRKFLVVRTRDWPDMAGPCPAGRVAGSTCRSSHRCSSVITSRAGDSASTRTLRFMSL